MGTWKWYVYCYYRQCYIASDSFDSPEPDLWATHVSPQDHAKDFMVLQELVTREKPLESQIVGPDVASSSGYFTQ